MSKPIISMIAAIGENRELGKNNDLPWGRALPSDLKRFRDKIRGHTVISGRKTFESMGAKPLPNRTNIIVTREENYKPEGVVVVHSVEEAIEEAKKSEQEATSAKGPGEPGEIFVIGGGQIFTTAMPFADRLYMTLIHAKFPDADTFFPEYPEFTNEVYREDMEENGYKYTFVDLKK